jgi:GT2 family glycosyltransferase
VEDVDFSLRLTKAGYRTVYQPQARVLHHSLRPGERPSPFQIIQRDRNRRRIMRKHFSFPRRFPFLVRFYLTRAILWLAYLLDGDRDNAKAILTGMAGGRP